MATKARTTGGETPKKKTAVKKTTAKKTTPKKKAAPKKVAEEPEKKQPWTLDRARATMDKAPKVSQDEVGATFTSPEQVEAARVETEAKIISQLTEEISDPMRTGEVTEEQVHEDVTDMDLTSSVASKDADEVNIPSKGERPAEVSKRVYEVPADKVQSPLIGKDKELLAKREMVENQEAERLIQEAEAQTRRMNPRGLGDVVANALESKAVKPLTDWAKKKIFRDGQDCGCEERQEKLNALFPMSQPLCLTENQYVNFLRLNTPEDEILSHGAFSRAWVNKLQNIHAEVFHHKRVEFCGNCGTNTIKTLKNWHADLVKLANLYAEENDARN